MTSYFRRHLSDITQIRDISSSSHEIIRLLSVAFETILNPADSRYHGWEYEDSIRSLESRIEHITADVMPGLNNTWVSTLELYKLSALIYLKRAARNFLGPSAQIDTMVDKGFEIVGDLETFDQAFPLLIFGCEARADDRRMTILELIERTAKTSSLMSLHGLRSILQRIWVQYDLAVEHELEYLKTLDAVISSYPIIPTFA
jgi:hypothetical protein